MKLSRKGFTLVELIVVIVIIGILAAIAAPSMTSNVTRAKKQEAIAAMGSIRTAYRLYRADKAPATPTTLVELNDAGFLTTAELGGQNYVSGNYSFTSSLITASHGTAALACNMDMNTGAIGNP